jgi:hypothetical protein
MPDPSETTQVSHSQDAELVDAVRALTDRVEHLQDEVRSLRAETHALPPGETDHHGWDERAATAVREGPAWVRSVDSPRPRGIAVPWLLLEIVFLVAVAVLCAVAGLDAPLIAGVMVAAWALVAVGEWLLSRAERERHALVYGAGTPPPVAGLPDDRSWFASNGDDTMLDLPSAERPPTRLPPPE